MKAVKLLLIAVIAIAAIIGISKLIGLKSDSESLIDNDTDSKGKVSTLYSDFENDIADLKNQNWNKELYAKYNSIEDGILRELKDKEEGKKTLVGKLDDVYINILYTGTKNVFNECKSDEIKKIQEEVYKWKQAYPDDTNLKLASEWLDYYNSSMQVIIKAGLVSDKASSLTDKFDDKNAKDINIDAKECLITLEANVLFPMRNCNRLMNGLQHSSIAAKLNERHYAFIVSLVNLFISKDFTDEAKNMTQDEFRRQYEAPVLLEIAKYEKMEIYDRGKKLVNDLTNQVVSVKDKYFNK
jgi:hypothetical protein